ncbi:hypothetical protein ACTVZO_39920 [Streptomyces sp. IBSNAI002]|uniref:hypothetical protein n=1 Tax=Streptomyces sp. IBSNAI002 TaxID=3457500 RepID=UPI003FD126FB
MGTNSKSSHESYAVSPTVATEGPPVPPNLGAPTPEPVMEIDPALLESMLIPEYGDEVPLAEQGGAWTKDGEPVFGAQATGDMPAEAPPEEEVETQSAAATAVDEAGDTPSVSEAVEAEDAAVPASEEAEGPVEGVGGAGPAVQGEVDELVEEEPEDTDPPLTPVPETPPAGVAVGTPILVGGEDFLNSQAALVSYLSPDGPREVLLAHVSEEAEGKLLDALSVSGTKMVDVQVEETTKERLALDKKEKLAELVTKATTSVQHKLKTGDAMSEASIQKHQTALDAVHAVLDKPNLTDDEKAMAQYYLDQVNTVGGKIQNGGAPMAHFEAHGQPVTKMVTKQIPAPADEPEPGTLAAQLRDASRIKASLDEQSGETSWDGKSRSKANGKEYAIDLGDGWSAVYRPYAANDPHSTEFSMRGQLEVHAPVGAGHGKQLVDRLEQLHLVNAPMTAAEGEWTYLSNNVTAQSLANAPGMKAAFAEAKGLEDLQVQEIVHQRAESLIGLDEDELHYQVKRIQLEAAQKVLPKKVKVLREAVAKATGFGGGDALAASAGYDPTPATSGGWLTWSRFDVTGKTAQVKEAFKGRSLTHSIGGGDMVALFGTGVLASTEKRAVMGIGGGVGMSEQQDKYTGGANSVFLRVSNSPKSGFGGQLIWDDPSVLMRRSDYYAYNGDKYGVSPDKKKASGLTRDPLTIATHGASNNEIMFRDGIDLLGAEAPSRIVCHQAHQRTALLESFKARGITHLGGKPVEDVVKTQH